MHFVQMFVVTVLLVVSYIYICISLWGFWEVTEKLIFNSFSVFKVFITKVIILSLEPVIVSRVVIRNISM